MAKRQKTTRFSVQGYDMAHYRQTEEYTLAVNALFDSATQDISSAAHKGNIDPEKPFSFDDYPSVRKVLQDTTERLASRMTTVIETGSKKQWLYACDKEDAFIESIFDTSRLTKAQLKKMQDRNLDALSEFQQRKVKGLGLSQRVWKYVGQYKEQIETALDVGLGEGRSAQELARDVKENLVEPDRLFRRVRDKRGNLMLSKAAKAFHPGTGVYRSSVKNAQRLTRSEINMAYRESDWRRWQPLDFVVGYEIMRSNHDPLCKCPMCAQLVGRYPKWFIFRGWHPQCMCYAVPILMDEETFDENELGDLKAALRGTIYKKKEAWNTVTDVPEGFKQWVQDHMEAQKGWSSTPYFIRDNFKDGLLSQGLMYPVITKAKTNVNAFVGAKSLSEAVEMAKSFGIKSVDFGSATIDEINIALEVLNDAAQQIGFELERFYIAPNLHKLLGESKPIGGYYNSGKNEIAIDLDSFRKNQYKAVVPYQDKITSLRTNISSLEKQIAQSEARLGRSKSMDKMLKADIKLLRSRISDIELKIASYERLIASGEEALPLTVAGTFKDIKEQVKAEIWHELGHYVDAKLNHPSFKSGKIISEYSKDMRGEEFAEWFAYYKMHGEKDVPKELLALFKSVEKKQGASATKKIDPVQQQIDALQPSIEQIRRECKAWGLNTYILDEAIAKRNVAEITKAIETLKNRKSAEYNALLAYMREATKVINEASRLKIDVSVVTNDVKTVTTDYREWVMGKTVVTQRLADLKAAVEAKKNSGIHPAMKTEYKTFEDVNKTFKAINAEFKTEKWFEHGDLQLGDRPGSGCNGSTYMDGRINLTPTRCRLVESALSKIGQGKAKDITFEEADAMATFWHEITHNRNVPGNMFTTSTQERYMELANEWIARHSLSEFYSKLGVKELPYPEFQTTRKSTGYNTMVTNYDYVIDILKLDRSKVYSTVRKHLFNEKYNTQVDGLKQGLVDGGIHYLTTDKKGKFKPLSKSDLNSLVKLIKSASGAYDFSTQISYTKEEQIKNWLIEHDILPKVSK